jgi:hypothetical protein
MRWFIAAEIFAIGALLTLSALIFRNWWADIIELRKRAKD